MRALAPLLLVACAGAPAHVLPPVVEVAQVTGTLRARPGLVLEVSLVVHNQNKRPFSLRAADWEVRAGGRPRVRGRTPLAATVPPGEAARVDVDCEIGPGAAAELIPLLASGIEIEAVLHLDRASGRVRWSGPLSIP